MAQSIAQNIYDTPEFFKNYLKLPRQVKGLGGSPEWPRMHALLPPKIDGFHILDVGCGLGWFCRWAADNGATSVCGVDLSQNMLERAKSLAMNGKYEVIKYVRTDLEAFNPEGLGLGKEPYDLIFSSLTLHYLTNLPDVVAKIQAMLKPGGDFVFSVEHPIRTAPINPGVQLDESTGKKYWPLSNYQVEGERVTNWLADGVRKQHRTIGTYVAILLGAGFALTGLDEWYPTEEQLAAQPVWADASVRPEFMLVRATKL